MVTQLVWVMIMCNVTTENIYATLLFATKSSKREKTLLHLLMYVYVHQVALGSFTVYVLSSPENVLDANKAFVSLALFNIMNFPLSFMPIMLAYIVQVCTVHMRTNMRARTNANTNART